MASFKVTGSIVDASGYSKVTVALLVASGTISDNDLCHLEFSATGTGGIANRTVDTMTGDNSDTTLSLSQSPASENNVSITFDGVMQHHDTYSLSGSTITFSTAPPTGVKVEAVSGGLESIGTPSDGTVTLAKMAVNSIDSDQYVDGSIDNAHLAANSVDSDNYVDGSIDNDHLASGVSSIGQHTIWVPAGAMEAAVTTAAATSNAVEIGTSLFAARTMDFVTGSDQYAYFGIQMPKSWDAGALVCQFVWSATGTTANTVLWAIAATSLSNDEVLTTAFPTPTSPAADTNSTTADDIMITAEVSVTVSSSPAAEDYVVFEVSRDVSGDTLSEDARLHGIKIHYTTDTGSDS
jgi:hypothetical protein